MEIPRRVRYRCPTVRSAVPSCIVAPAARALRRFVALSTLAALSAPVAPAGADTVPAALTREFQAGVDAYRLGKYDDARTHLDRAQAIDPKLPGPHRFLAAVAQAQRRWADCIAEARRALQLNPRSREIAETRKLHDGCRESDGRPAYRGDLGDAAAIAVTANVAGATVKIGGLRYGGTPVAPRLIKPGLLRVDVEKSGWKPARVTVDALPAIVTDIAVELAPVAPAGSPSPTAPAAPPGAAR